MARECASCTAPGFGPELDRQLKAGVPLTLVSAWTAEQGLKISRAALARHRRDHLALVTRPGRKPISDDYLEAVRDDAASRLGAGEIRATLKDGIAAQKGIDARLARFADRDLMYRIALALTGGGVPVPRLPDEFDHQREAIEAEFRPLLAAGDQPDEEREAELARLPYAERVRGR